MWYHATRVAANDHTKSSKKTMLDNLKEEVAPNYYKACLRLALSLFLCPLLPPPSLQVK